MALSAASTSDRVNPQRVEKSGLKEMFSRSLAPPVRPRGRGVTPVIYTFLIPLPDFLPALTVVQKFSRTPKGSDPYVQSLV